MKKAQQLGMNPSTASHRLVKDLLFMFLTKTGEVCHQCKKPMAREDFSIEHKVPWLDGEDPQRLFFDLDNIAFSHRSCNFSAKRCPDKIYFSNEEKLEAKRRWKRECDARNYDPVKRHNRYKNTGY